MILPGATLGVMGGGQLGRMFTTKALSIGYRVVVFDPDQRSPAGLISSYHICAPYDDVHALDEMIELCDAITLEFENIPLQSIEYLAEGVPVSPPPEAVRIAQDRILEKSFFRNNNLATADFAPIYRREDVQQAVEVTGLPCIIKTARFGYDGKGQALCHNADEVEKAFVNNGEVVCILERKIDLAKEVSVILACGRDCEISAYPPAENTHINGILDTTVVPAELSGDQKNQVLEMAKKLAECLNYVGVLAVELFLSRAGDICINEIAPRPHNSGHYTQDASDTSQFEQQVRMMCDLPAGSTHLKRHVVMQNILGDMWGESPPHWDKVFETEGAFLHLYGKYDARPGRKMGHVNIIGSKRKDLLKRAEALKQSMKA